MIKAAKARFEEARKKAPAVPAEANPPARPQAKGKAAAAVAAGVAAATAGTGQGADLRDAPAATAQCTLNSMEPAGDQCASARRSARQYISKSSLTNPINSMINLGKKLVCATALPLFGGGNVNPVGLVSAPSNHFESVAPALSTGGIVGQSTVPAMLAVLGAASAPKSDQADQAYDMEYILDTGVGRTIGSEKEFIKQGVPRTACTHARGQASDKITFTTGGGEKRV